MNAEQRPSAPQPAPEQPDPILNWARQRDTLSRILTRPVALYESVGLGELRKRLEQAHSQTSNLLREKLVEEAKEFVVFEAPKPQPKSSKEPGFGAIAAAAVRGLEKRRRRERKEKSRGLHDPRPIEFSVPETGKKLRGKEGKGLKLVYKSATNTLVRDQLARQLYPGIKLEVARNNVNRTMRSARKHLAGSRFDVVTRRDYNLKTTFYDWVEKPRKPKQKKKR